MHGSTPNIICVGTMSADVPPPPVGSIGPWGRGELKTQKIRGGFIRAYMTATISIFLSDAKCGPVCRAQTCAHSVVEPVKIGQGVSTGWAKKFEKISNFSPFRDFTSIYIYIYISQKLFKIEAYKQCMQKGLSLPYPTVASVWTNRSRSSTGWAKN